MFVYIFPLFILIKKMISIEEKKRNVAKLSVIDLCGSFLL